MFNSSFASKPHTPWAKSFCPFRACCLMNTPTKLLS